MEVLLFWLLSLIALTGAVLVVVRRSPVDCALALLLTMIALAGHYLLLHAWFLAVVHLLVYAGAVLVLFLFVMMLLDLRQMSPDARVPYPKKRWLFALVGAGLMVALAGTLRGVGYPQSAVLPEGFGTLEAVGSLLYQRWLWPFELAGILLLTAMIAALALARHARHAQAGGEEQ